MTNLLVKRVAVFEIFLHIVQKIDSSRMLFYSSFLFKEGCFVEDSRVCKGSLKGVLREL